MFNLWGLWFSYSLTHIINLEWNQMIKKERNSVLIFKSVYFRGYLDFEGRYTDVTCVTSNDIRQANHDQQWSVTFQAELSHLGLDFHILDRIVTLWTGDWHWEPCTFSWWWKYAQNYAPNICTKTGMKICADCTFRVIDKLHSLTLWHFSLTQTFVEFFQLLPITTQFNLAQDQHWQLIQQSHNSSIRYNMIKEAE